MGTFAHMQVNIYKIIYVGTGIKLGYIITQKMVGTTNSKRIDSSGERIQRITMKSNRIHLNSRKAGRGLLC
jgi:hypothetical protein